MSNDQDAKVLLDFFKVIKDKPRGMKGFMIMDDLQDIQESVVLTFWERKKICMPPEACILRSLLHGYMLPLVDIDG
jgi:hypothetical protein